MGIIRPSLASITTNVSNITDNISVFNSSQSGANNQDIGVIYNRGTNVNVALIWNETTSSFRTVYTSSTGSSSGNITITANADFRTGNLYASGTSTFTGNVTSGHILPSANVTYDIGSPTNQYRHIYVGPGTLYVNGNPVITDNSGTIQISTSSGQNLSIVASGAGQLQLATDTSGYTALSSNLQIGSGKTILSSDGSAISFSNSANIAGLVYSSSAITQNNTNQNITVVPNGTGVFAVTGSQTISKDLTISGNLTISGTTTTVNTTTLSVADNLIDLNSDVTVGTPTENAGIRVLRGDSTAVQVRWNETDDKWEFTNDGATYYKVPISTTDLAEGTNQYFTNARARSAISVSGSGSYDSSTGVITVTGGVTSVNSLTGGVTLGLQTVVASNATASSAITISNTTSSTNTTSGALIVSGGVGVAGNINAGNVSATNLSGTLLTASQTNITSVGTLGSLAVTGNVSANNYIVTEGIFYANGTQFSSGGAGSSIPSLYNGVASNVTTSATLIDSVPVTGNVTVQWTLSSTDNTNSRYKSSRIDSITDGTSSYYSEYAVVKSNDSYDVATFTSNISGGAIKLWATGDSANVYVQYQRLVLGSATTSGYLSAQGEQGIQGNTGPAWSGTGILTNVTISESTIVGRSAVSVNTSATEIDSFSVATYRSAKYIITTTDNTNSEYQISELLLLSDGTNANIVQYGDQYSGSTSRISFTASIATGTVTLYGTGTSASNSVRVHRILFPV